MANHIQDMQDAYNQVINNSELITEGAIADKMRANLKAKKKDWDKKGEAATSAGYKALDKAKKTQDELEKSDYIQDVGESCIKTDSDIRNMLRTTAGLEGKKSKGKNELEGKPLTFKTREKTGKMVSILHSQAKPKESGRTITKEDYYYVTALLLGENICLNSDEAFQMINRFESIDENLIDQLVN